MIEQRLGSGRAWRSLLALLAVFALVAAACGGDDDDTEATGGGTSATTEGESGDGEEPSGETEELTIGMIESLSGDFVPFSVPPADGVRLAVQEINEAGGFEVDGVTYTINLEERDDRSEEAAAVAGTLELVEDVGVKYIFGPTVSALANQAQEITTANDVLEISAAGSWQGLGYLEDPDKPLLFGTQVPPETRGEVLASGIEQLGDVTKVGLMSQDDDTTAGNIPAFLDAFEARDIEVVEALFPPNTTDFTPFLNRLKGEGIDVLFYFFPQGRAEEAIRLAEELDVATVGYATFNVDPTFAIDEPLSKPMFSAQAAPSFVFPATEEVEEFKARVLEFDPDIPLNNANFIFYTYDIVYMLVEAMQEAGTVEDVAAVAEALQEVVYDGAAGTVCWKDDARVVKYDTGHLFVRDGEVESQAFPSDC